MMYGMITEAIFFISQVENIELCLENSVLDVLCNVEHSVFIENKYSGLSQLLIINFRMKNHHIFVEQ